jgi:hypothetical protein
MSKYPTSKRTTLSVHELGPYTKEPEESPPDAAASKPARPTTSMQRTVGSPTSLHCEGHLRILNRWGRSRLKNESLSAYCASKTQKLNRTATHTNEYEFGHGKLHRGTGWEIRHLHGVVLLRYVLRRWKRRELGIEGAREDNVAELLGWGGAGSTLTQQKPDCNRNGLETRYGVLPMCVLFWLQR